MRSYFRGAESIACSIGRENLIAWTTVAVMIALTLAWIATSLAG